MKGNKDKSTIENKRIEENKAKNKRFEEYGKETKTVKNKTKTI